MGQYKVPQNVEAEDKIIGALTMKQFIYAVIGVGIAFLSYVLFHAFPILMVIIGLPPTVLFLLLGLYQRQDQPFEAYLLALVTFYASPRRRIWHKDDIAEVFKLEAPKLAPVAAQRDSNDVRGQLEKLSQVVDTRGWSSKMPEVQDPAVVQSLDVGDRIQTAQQVATPVAAPEEVKLADDILDFNNNPIAQNVNELIENSVKDIREEALAKMRNRPANQVSDKPLTAGTIVNPIESTSGMTANPLNDILKSAIDSEDLTVSQVAAQATRKLQQDQEVTLRSDTNGSTQ
jgi:hypothetical protein